MRKKREPVPHEDSGWQPEGDRPLCADGHRGRLMIAMDFAASYRNTYTCRVCRAWRVVSGPKSAHP